MVKDLLMIKSATCRVAGSSPDLAPGVRFGPLNAGCVGR
jgi:hypothetical protein